MRFLWKLAGAWADALWRRFLRNGTIRHLPNDRYDTAPRRLSPAETARAQAILDRHRRRRDFTQDGAITMADLVASGATEALVSLQQACDLYTELQQTVCFEDCADMEGVAFRPRKPAWRGILIRPVVA